VALPLDPTGGLPFPRALVAPLAKNPVGAHVYAATITLYGNLQAAAIATSTFAILAMID